MKNTFTIFLCLLTSLLAAQDCESVLVNREGALVEYTMYDAKHNYDGKTAHKVSHVDEADGVTNAEIAVRMEDKKGKEVVNSTYDISCSGSELKIDASQLVASLSQATQAEGVEMVVTGDMISLPKEAPVGTILPDANLDMELRTDGRTMMTYHITIKDRMIEAKEEVTTDAGTFSCFKLVYAMNLKMGPINIKTSAAEWYSGQELIKSESYNKKGKLVGSQELTKIER